MRKFFIIFITLLLIFACNKKITNNKIKIITTLFPLYDFAMNVASDKAEVSLLLPPGVESHSFEPSVQDLIKINECDIFIYTGKYMEPWIEKTIKNISNKNVKIIDASLSLDLLDIDEKDHADKDEQEHSKDPHIWLDFDIDQKIINQIADGLIQADSQNKDFYLKNASAYNAKLDELDKKYEEALKKCRLKIIISGGHFAFGYMVKKYNLIHISPYKNFNAYAEPSIPDIIEMIDKIKQYNAKYIFFEELLEPKTAKIIAKETGVNLLLLHAAHNITKKEIDNKITFMDIMERNLENLKTGLEYQ